MCIGLLLDSSRWNDASCGVSLVITLPDAPSDTRSIVMSPKPPRPGVWDMSRYRGKAFAPGGPHGMLVRFVSGGDDYEGGIHEQPTPVSVTRAEFRATAGRRR
ncbi:hypothetical protein NWFMUON74_13680 [Nocardia wallacei]|uniref:Uncharacterized protein n=1 Tax=Nocardia wallacei TaxID=480035 RepID=A0A7G1KGA7_9NOCA|nr:hypothetical protein NWFMUON74_13680 [Nocardia wallacei]